jgi:hypothetical protein
MLTSTREEMVHFVACYLKYMLLCFDEVKFALFLDGIQVFEEVCPYACCA